MAYLSKEHLHPAKRPVLSQEYMAAFYSWLKSGGTIQNAALYEQSNTAGGYAVPVNVDGQIVPYAPPDTGVRRLATIVPTVNDVHFPTKTANSAAALKPESGASVSNFSSSSPTLGSFTLSAFMVGVEDGVSFEFSQDIPAFTTFLSQDAMLALDTVEESLYIGGSGVQQPQGLLGNTGPGVTGVMPDSNGFLLPVAATYDVLSTLKSVYHRNASWLMQRSTAVQLRKAASTSTTANELVFTRVGNQDYLHGYPIEYSSVMPVVAAGSTPVLFGDFSIGYLIGERGGPGVRVKVLDQLQALMGVVPYMAFRRVDGRVRRSEAMQAITLHA